MTKAETVKAGLKAAGYKQTQVSVRGSASSVTVTIRDAAVDYAKVKEIASQVEHIRHDNATGEILQGGNTFVTVAYFDGVVEKLAHPHLVSIMQAVTDERDYTLGTWQDGYNVAADRDDASTIRIWRLEDGSGRHVQQCWGAEDAAKSLVRVLLSTGRRDLLGLTQKAA